MHEGPSGYRGRTDKGPFQKKYLGAWVDSGSPAIYQTEGSFNVAGDVYTEVSRGPDPSGKPLILRMTTTVAGADQPTFEMYRVNSDGHETLMSEMEHVRD